MGKFSWQNKDCHDRPNGFMGKYIVALLWAPGTQEIKTKSDSIN